MRKNTTYYERTPRICEQQTFRTSAKIRSEFTAFYCLQYLLTCCSAYVLPVLEDTKTEYLLGCSSTILFWDLVKFAVNFLGECTLRIQWSILLLPMSPTKCNHLVNCRLMLCHLPKHIDILLQLARR